MNNYVKDTNSYNVRSYYCVESLLWVLQLWNLLGDPRIFSLCAGLIACYVRSRTLDCYCVCTPFIHWFTAMSLFLWGLKFSIFSLENLFQARDYVHNLFDLFLLTFFLSTLLARHLVFVSLSLKKRHVWFESYDFQVCLHVSVLLSVYFFSPSTHFSIWWKINIFFYLFKLWLKF